eukprot:gnl/TRDRNA2_/TRDRNA2_160413_c0_seq1.p1 gnl/TRDRNA2_/TRDRNA2_160413_c0~~gnl/TRDRNA2_/TRDRNA2_160413_c0_seq1.p1  ORF type:complete len:677 (+),score=133.86 gnl/TRDRNA2_/TRDRNA2_160413_c0_seq1:72-2033(+)
MRLFVEYFKLMFLRREIFWKSTLQIVLDQAQNLYLGLQLYIVIYIVDVLFNMAEEEESREKLLVDFGPHEGRYYTAVVIGFSYVAPMILLHVWDMFKVKLDLGGLIDEFLKISLFNRYLNYTEDSRQRVKPSIMHTATMQDTMEVTEGYVATLKLIQVIGKLLILMMFVKSENPRALKQVCLMPLLMLCFVAFRSKVLMDTAEFAAIRTIGLLEVVHETCTAYRFIQEYKQRPRMFDYFREATIEVRNATVHALQVQTNNDYFAKWLGPLFIGVYIVRHATAVLEGELSLGTCLAMIRIFNEISVEFTEAYAELIKICKAFAPLKKLTYFFNLPEDVLLWKFTNRQRRQMTRAARLEMQSSGAAGGRLDSIALKVLGLSLHYGEKLVLADVLLAQKQGSIVAVIGEHGSGKATLMRLLGHSLFPDEGLVFVPSHLRTLFISQELTLLNLSVWSNLTFGDATASPSRVGALLRRLKLDKILSLMTQDLKDLGRVDELYAADDDGCTLNLTSSDIPGPQNEGDEESAKDLSKSFEGQAWQDTLSYGEKAKLNLARSLIMNPEVLVLQRPLSHYDNEAGDLVLNALVEHVRNRGVCLPSNTCHRRRPRTMFMSPSTQKELRNADNIWEVNKGTKGVLMTTFESILPEDYTRLHIAN